MEQVAAQTAPQQAACGDEHTLHGHSAQRFLSALEQSTTEAYAVTQSRRLEGMLELLWRSSKQRIMPILEQVDFEN